MAKRRYPTPRIGDAIITFLFRLILLCLLAAGVFLFVFLRDFTATEQAARVEAGDTTDPWSDPTGDKGQEAAQLRPTPTPMPAPQATPIPSAAYVNLVQRQDWPQTTGACRANLTEYLSGRDPEGRSYLVIRGWAFLEGYDAFYGMIYLTVTRDEDEEPAIYSTISTPGYNGIDHGSERGENLEQADFLAALNCSNLPDGRYTLGVRVAHGANGGGVMGEQRFPEEYAFFVVNGRMISS